jgi:hypothetical protein
MQYYLLKKYKKIKENMHINIIYIKKYIHIPKNIKKFLYRLRFHLYYDLIV